MHGAAPGKLHFPGAAGPVHEGFDRVGKIFERVEHQVRRHTLASHGCCARGSPAGR